MLAGTVDGMEFDNNNEDEDGDRTVKAVIVDSKVAHSCQHTDAFAVRCPTLTSQSCFSQPVPCKKVVIAMGPWSCQAEDW